ncbi:chemotaxis protein CheX [Magnetococcales bacterium HHB-1]
MTEPSDALSDQENLEYATEAGDDGHTMDTQDDDGFMGGGDIDFDAPVAMEHNDDGFLAGDDVSFDGQDGGDGFLAGDPVDFGQQPVAMEAEPEPVAEMIETPESSQRDKLSTEEMREKLMFGLRDTVTDVLETMASSPNVLFAGLEQSSSFILSSEVSGVIRLLGRVEGLVGISANKSLTSELVSRITGLPADDLEDEDILDGMAELTNMVCGGMKAKAAIGQLDLTSPAAIIGSDYTAQWKALQETSILTFQIDSQELKVFACF